VCMAQVLATDMSKHLDHLAHLKTMVETHRLSGGSATLLLCDVSERLQVTDAELLYACCIKLLLLLHPFYGLFLRTASISQYQKGKTSLDLNEARDDGVLGCIHISWTICKQSAPRCTQITR